MKPAVFLLMALIWTSVGLRAPAEAASPFLAIPVGQQVNYHITSQAVTQDGPTSSSHNVLVRRVSPNQYAVSLDGGVAVLVTAGPGGPNIPPGMRSALAPFGMIDALLQAAPAPILASSVWGAAIPVPLGGEVETVPMSVNVAQAGPTGAQISAIGQSGTEVQPGVRAFPTTINVSSQMYFNAAHILTGGSGKISIVVHRRLGRTDNFGSSWTVTLQ